jgi:hypothetical protein
MSVVGLCSVTAGLRFRRKREMPQCDPPFVGKSFDLPAAIAIRCRESPFRLGMRAVVMRWKLPPFRRGVRISLRTLFVGITLLAVWLGYICRQARLQRELVERVHALGGSVSYDYEFDADGNRLKDPQPPGWPWLRRLIGGEFFLQVRGVNLYDTEAADSDLQLLACCPSLQQLNLRATNVTGEGLRHLQNLHELEDLNLGETAVDGEGLTHLGELPKLELLALDSTRVDSTGLFQLGDLANAHLLSLGNSRVDDAIIPRLVGLKRLEILQVSDTSISGEGLLRLHSALSDQRVWLEMELVSVHGSSLFDESAPPRRREALFTRLRALADEGRLKALDLSDTRFNDQHQTLLSGLNNVEIIDLRGTQVSEEGLAQLRREFPDVEFLTGPAAAP